MRPQPAKGIRRAKQKPNTAAAFSTTMYVTMWLTLIHSRIVATHVATQIACPPIVRLSALNECRRSGGSSVMTAAWTRRGSAAGGGVDDAELAAPSCPRDLIEST